MRPTSLIATLGLLIASGAGAATLRGARSADPVERIDFHTTRTATTPAFDAALAPMPHSIDFHSARIAANVAYRTIMKGDTVTFEFTATDPGAYLIHCGTPPMTMHVMQGMYMAMIVDPRPPWRSARVFQTGASGEALYPFVTHSFADAEKGAVGVIQVGTPKTYTNMAH